MDMMWYRRRGLMVTPHLESVTGSIASFNSDYNKIRIKSVVCNIDPIQDGSGDPSPENVRPISGRDGVKVTRTGFNQWDEEWEVGDLSNSGQPITASDRIRTKNFIRVIPNKYYYFKTGVSGQTLWQLFGCYYDEDKNFISTFYRRNSSLTMPSNCHYIKWATTGGYGTTYNHDISINYPATDTEYHAYQGQPYDITFPSEAGTVYGGYVDVVSGKLVMDRAMVTLDGTHYTLGGRNTFTNVARYYVNQNIQLRARGRDSLVMADRAMPSYDATIGISNNTPTGYYIWVHSSNTVLITLPVDVASSNAEATAWLAENPIQLVYELATPTEIQLTPQEVKALLGVNNIWCDSGEVTVDYWKWGK